MKKVYLAGAIDGISREQATSWRAEATEALRKAGIDVIDPTKMLDVKEVCNNSEVIVTASFVGVYVADILLVEMDRKNCGYIGTATEIFWAWDKKKPIIVWGTANRHSHFLQYYATRFFDTLNEAIEYIIKHTITQNQQI